jgi:hypothetical protein
MASHVHHAAPDGEISYPVIQGHDFLGRLYSALPTVVVRRQHRYEHYADSIELSEIDHRYKVVLDRLLLERPVLPATSFVPARITTTFR